MVEDGKSGRLNQRAKIMMAVFFVSMKEVLVILIVKAIVVTVVLVRRRL